MGFRLMVAASRDSATFDERFRQPSTKRKRVCPMNDLVHHRISGGRKCEAAERRWDVARGASPWKRSRRRIANPRRGRQVPDNRHSNHAMRPHRRDVPVAPFGGFSTSTFRIPGADAPGYTLSSLRDFDLPEIRR